MTQSNDLRLIPRKLFFGNPDRSSLRISPDSVHLSWLAPLDGVMNVWIAPRDNPSAARPVTRDTGRGIRIYFWAYTNLHILFLQDKAGDENWRLFSTDSTTGTVVDLTPFAGAQAQISAVSHLFPNEIVIALNNRNPQWHDVHRIDVTTGKMNLLLQNDRFAGVTIDHDFEIALAVQMTSDGGMDFYRLVQSVWERWDGVPPDDAMTTSPIGYDKSNKIVFLKDSRGRNTSALMSLTLKTKHAQLLGEDSRCDVGDVVRHPTEHHVQAVSFIYDRQKWVILDESVKADFAYLQTVADGELSIASRSLDDQFWIVTYVIDDGPAGFYLYDRTQQSAKLLFTNRKELEIQPLAKMNSPIIKSRDGLDLVCYCTFPPGSDSNNDGVPDQPQPMVLIPHGGPWHRDYWGFHPWHQWLANRGYVVLSVNFRASTGFGKAFINAGNREWGGKIMEDQVDAVQWAIDSKIADPKRIAVMGGSFGGYSTLGGLTFTPELFACGIDLVGVANLITWMKAIPPYWKPQLDLVIQRVGDPNTEKGLALLKKHSPLTYVDRICRPLLIAQGANDPRVRKEESDQIADSMKERNIPVTYLLYPDEGHGFARPENNLSFYAIAEAFLAQCLGGRCEPIGDSFNDSSMQVLSGESYIPGLAEALGAQGES